MEIALVGSTGFVGSNIAAKAEINGLYHSSTVANAYGTRPELLIYAGVRAEMFLANTAPEEDLKNMEIARENIRRIAPKRLVLISTVAVYDKPYEVDEDDRAGTGALAYGKNRFALEQWAAEDTENCHIVRLPALFGKI